MARPRKYKTAVPGLSPYFDKRNNKVYWRYRHPITGKNHGLGSIDQKLAETIAAEANSRLARQQMEQMLSLQEKIINDTGGSSTVSIFLNNYRKIQQERYENGEIILNPLYRFEEDENSTLEKVSGTLKRTENPLQNDFKLRLAGIYEDF